MSTTDLERRRQELIDSAGPWTAHCIHLGDNVYTFTAPHVPQVDSRLRRIVQAASDLSERPLNELRILDLACLEGHFGIEFALHGSEVIAIEGRETNLAKAIFAKDMLSLNNITFVLDDVRNLHPERYGYFDIVLCLGILYHLDALDIGPFLQRVLEVTKRAVIIDTHVCIDKKASFLWNGDTYWGKRVVEHDEKLTSEQRLKALWRSLDNPTSFILTQASLYNMLRHVGFTSVYEVLNPYEYHNPRWPLAQQGDKFVVREDRLTLVAIKGMKQNLVSSPVTDKSPEIDRFENPVLVRGGIPSPGVIRFGAQGTLRSMVGRIVPRPLRRTLRKLL